MVDSLILILGEGREDFYTRQLPRKAQDDYVRSLFEQLRSGAPKRGDFRKEFAEEEAFGSAPKEKPRESRASPELLSSELLGLIKKLLSCRVTVGNVYVVYENNVDFLTSGGDLNLKHFNLTMHLKQLEFRSEQIEKYLDKDQVFKGFLNFGEFLRRSGTLGSAKDVYWAVQMEQFRVYFGSGELPFYDASLDLEHK